MGSSFFLYLYFFFFFNDTATTEIYTLSLHDALPIYGLAGAVAAAGVVMDVPAARRAFGIRPGISRRVDREPQPRSEEHTSELQSRQYLVCRLLLEKKKTKVIKSSACISGVEVSRILL